MFTNLSLAELDTKRRTLETEIGALELEELEEESSEDVLEALLLGLGGLAALGVGGGRGGSAEYFVFFLRCESWMEESEELWLG